MTGKPTLWPRTRGSTTTYYILEGGRMASTGFKLGQEAEAEAALAARIVASPQRVPLAADFFDVPVATVLEEVLERLGQTAHGSSDDRQRFATALSCVENLLPYWEAKRVGDVCQDSFDDYIARRVKENLKGQKVGARREQTASRESAISELAILRRGIVVFGEEHGYEGLPDFGVLRRRGKKIRYVSRDEVARLVLAGRGRIWDLAKSDWKRGPDGRPIRAVPHESYASAVRMTLLELYTGCELPIAEDMVWEPDPAGERSHPDLETGTLHRAGPGAPAPGSPLAAVEVPLTKRLRAHLTRWRRIDLAQGHAPVIHGRIPGVGTDVSRNFRKLRKAAGLPDVTLLTIRYSTGVWLVKGGAPDRAAAGFMGMTHEWFVRSYKVFQPGFLAGAKAALELRARSVRGGRPAAVPRAPSTPAVAHAGPSAASHRANGRSPAHQMRAGAPTPPPSGGRRSAYAGRPAKDDVARAE